MIKIKFNILCDRPRCKYLFYTDKSCTESLSDLCNVGIWMHRVFMVKYLNGPIDGENDCSIFALCQCIYGWMRVCAPTRSRFNLSTKSCNLENYIECIVRLRRITVEALCSSLSSSSSSSSVVVVGLFCRSTKVHQSRCGIRTNIRNGWKNTQRNNSTKRSFG